MHRDCLNYKDIKVRMTTAQDLNHLDYLVSTVDNQDQVNELAKDAVIND
jgi:hypothetical protein